MKAACWFGSHGVRVTDVPVPPDTTGSRLFGWIGGRLGPCLSRMSRLDLNDAPGANQIKIGLRA